MLQYGFTLSDIKYRLSTNNSPKVLANSIPKSGTNLLLRALYLFPSMHRKLHKTLDNRSDNIIRVLSGLKNGEICSAHLKYSDNIFNVLDENNIKHIIIARDPRDIAVSNAMYITYKDVNHRLSNYFIHELENDDQRIMSSIKGIPADKLKDGIESLSLKSHYDGYMRWRENKGCLIVRFEDLVGENGGGSEKAQLKCMKSIINHIGLDVSDNEIFKVSKKVFNPASRTFVKGQIGSWKKKMSEEHKDEIKISMGRYLTELGYEKNDDW